eukprot:892261-Prorocentrum_minimum.AAC.1
MFCAEPLRANQDARWSVRSLSGPIRTHGGLCGASPGQSRRSAMRAKPSPGLVAALLSMRAALLSMRAALLSMRAALLYMRVALLSMRAALLSMRAALLSMRAALLSMRAAPT